ncbi:MAG: hypothetical protein IPM27_12320 [Nitrosomonadales bacterium]|nr:hypothetical protein [Nitrosomonadales bacterium]
MMRDGDDLLLDRDTLARMGLTRGLTADDGQRLSLKSLAPRLRFKLDESNGSVSIEADPAMLSGHTETLQLRQPSTATLISSNALYLNYNLNYNKSPFAADSYSAPLELAANWNGLSRINNFNWQNGRQLTRTQSQLVYDDTNELRRLMAGDVTGTSGNRLGSSTLGGSAHVQELRHGPSIFTGPPLAMQAMLLNPSEVEVYIAGNMVFKASSPPENSTCATSPTTAPVWASRRFWCAMLSAGRVSSTILSIPPPACWRPVCTATTIPLA